MRASEGDLIIGIRDCEAYAQKYGEEHARFTALFPSGPRICTWLDPWMGILQIEGVTDGTFLMTRDIAEMCPGLVCIPHNPREGSEPKAETEGLGAEPAEPGP
jgi:hypothetical protein